MLFNGFKEEQNEFEYVKFNNIWGYRNFSRAAALKRKVKQLILKENKKYDTVVVYSAHEPFLEAAEYAKKLLPDVKICFVVPDLPQYMNLDSNKTKIYDLLKKVDIKRMDKLIKSVDSFVILTEYMKDMIDIGSRPYFVAEGIIEDISKTDFGYAPNQEEIKTIVYAGKMNEAFGLKDLVDAFTELDGDNYRLVLCGDGDSKEYVLQKANEDSRIDYQGQVSPNVAKEIIDSASVLVNPRPNDSEYTKYSFPSKNIEYLMSGKAVVAYMLDGMPDIYSDFIYTINSKESIKDTLISALNSDNTQKHKAFLDYAEKNLVSKSIVEKLVKL